MKVKELEIKLEQLALKMDVLARYAVPSKYSNTEEYKEKAKEYYVVQGEFVDVREELNSARNEIARSEKSRLQK